MQEHTPGPWAAEWLTEEHGWIMDAAPALLAALENLWNNGLIVDAEGDHTVEALSAICAARGGSCPVCYGEGFIESGKFGRGEDCPVCCH